LAHKYSAHPTPENKFARSIVSKRAILAEFILKICLPAEFVKERDSGLFDQVIFGVIVNHLMPPHTLFLMQI
jgi:hypothetical protein